MTSIEKNVWESSTQRFISLTKQQKIQFLEKAEFMYTQFESYNVHNEQVINNRVG